MEIPKHRRWMINRLMPQRVGYTQEFLDGLEEFDAFAKAQPFYPANQMYRCPCVKCDNRKFLSSDDVKLHLLKKGFVRGYWYWTCHGEVEPKIYDSNIHSRSSNMIHANNLVEPLPSQVECRVEENRTKSRCIYSVEFEGVKNQNLSLNVPRVLESHQDYQAFVNQKICDAMKHERKEKEEMEKRMMEQIAKEKEEMDKRMMEQIAKEKEEMDIRAMEQIAKEKEEMDKRMMEQEAKEKLEMEILKSEQKRRKFEKKLKKKYKKIMLLVK